jgi:hypothetical protein
MSSLAPALSNPLLASRAACGPGEACFPTMKKYFVMLLVSAMSTIAVGQTLEDYKEAAKHKDPYTYLMNHGGGSSVVSPSPTPYTAATPATYSSDGWADANAIVMPVLIIVVVGLCLFFWLLPGFIASNRHHHNAGAIWCLTILLGWTFLGWVIAIVWAFTNVPIQARGQQ